MRNHFSLIFSCALLGPTQVGAMDFNGQWEGRAIGRSLEYVVDTTGLLDALSILSRGVFAPVNDDIPNLGISKSITWLKLDLRNHSTEPHLLLTVAYADIDRIDLFEITTGSPVLLGIRGQEQGSVDGSSNGDDYMFKLDLGINQAKQYLIAIRGHKQIHVPIFIGTPLGALERSTLRSLLVGGFIGIMLVLALYNLFVFISIRDKGYLIYVIYILVNGIGQLTLTGTAQNHFWPELPWLAKHASVLFVLSSIGTGIVFTRHFISTKAHAPRLDRLAPVFYIMILVNAGVYLFGDSQVGYKMAQGISGCSSLYLMSSAVICYRSGSRPAAFFLLAWGFFLVGVLLFVMKDSGVLPYTSLTVYAMPLGSAIEGILLSFGLADRINVLRREKEFSQAAALASSLENERIIREQNAMLEEKVTERTHALQETNEHLKLTQTKLVNAEKMASLGQLTAGIAHEINNPINFITSNILPLRRNITEIVEVMQAYRALEPAKATEQLKALKDREKKLGINESIEELDDIIGSIAEGSSRTAEIVRGLRNFSRLDEDDLKEVDLNDGLRSTIALLAPQYREKVAIELELGLTPAVECYPGKVNQVFMNVLTNAFQATIAKADCASPLVRIATRSEGDRVIITVKDNGIGMSQEVRSRMFEPFFTTKAVGDGTGLGLAIVYGIIEDHHGTISAETAIGLGTELRIEFPIQHPREQQRRA